MGITERREREKAEVRTKILDAARDLFAREGYEAVTMRRIARAIEYSPTAIYLHFADKEALVRTLCDEDFRALAKAFVRIAREKDPLERLRRIGLAYLDFAMEHPNAYRLMFMTPKPVKPTPEELARTPEPEEDAYAFLRATVVAAMEAGMLVEELKDPDLVAQALWAGVHGVASLHIAMAADGFIEMKPAKRTGQLVVEAQLAGMKRRTD
jgi:AcrR family transcriptional regulator